MKKISLRRCFVLFLIALYGAGMLLFVFRYTANAEKWAFYETNRHVYTDGQITEIGPITDYDGNVLAETVDGKRQYSEDAAVREATLHVVGDRKGFISTGVQNALRDRLTGYNEINGVYTYSGSGYQTRLTVNSQVSVAAMRALGNYAGCVGMYNYKTGEVICMVSTPTFDVDDEQACANAESGAVSGIFMNRFLSSVYTPGSTFKMVTATASLEKNGDAAYDMEFICKKGAQIDGETVSCVGRHNTITLNRAFSHSCNAYFSQLAVSLGKKTMTHYAEMYGFNQKFSIDGIPAARSSYRVENEREIDFAWSGIGQSTVQMNPLQYLCAVGAIANGGEYAHPYLVKSITSEAGFPVYTAKTQTTRMLSRETAEKVAGLLDYAVEDNYKKTTFGSLDVCGKTGTAEVGNGVENSLFVGFCKDENLPLAFVVVVEGGGSGKKSALMVANRTLNAAKEALQTVS